MRTLLRTGKSAAALALMFAGALLLWVGVPLAWLYIGSMVQDATDSVGAAIGLMLLGSVASILLLVPLLGRVNNVYEHAREARGLENYGQAPLEAVLVLSATVAVVLLVAYVLLSNNPALPIWGGTP